MPQSWKEFFDAHAPHYDENSFTENTVEEVDFLLEILEIEPGQCVLDMGCGTGRHSIELARRGYAVTGVDISAGMLEQAIRKSKEQSVDVTWLECDGRTFQSSSEFDAAICLCEGGFGLSDLKSEPVGNDLALLKAIFSVLRPRAIFVLTALNGYAQIRQMTDDAVQSGAFDPSTMVACYEDTMALPEGEVTLNIRERQFIAPELVAMLHYVGFRVEHVWGGTAGEWGRRPLKLDEIEVMVVSRKPDK